MKLHYSWNCSGKQTDFFNVSSSDARFHSMIIQLYLSLASKSSATYEELRNSNILRLISMLTLRDYKNFIERKAGFQEETLKDFIKSTRYYPRTQHFVALLFDKMIISGKFSF